MKEMNMESKLQHGRRIEKASRNWWNISGRLVSSMGSRNWNELRKQLAKEEKARFWTWKRENAEQEIRSRNGLNKDDYEEVEKGDRIKMKCKRFFYL
jgi:hypothetical protein